MAKKTTYKPRAKKEVFVKEVVVVPSISEETNLPIVVEEVVDNSSDGQEIQISPLTPSDFCKHRKIVGVYRDFLEKKYATKSYTLEVWTDILVKENIN